MPLVVLPDAQRMAIDYLREIAEVTTLTGGTRRVYSEVPATASWPLVVLFQIGGSQQIRGWLHRARLQLEAWDDDSEFKAHELARVAYSALLAMKGSIPAPPAVAFGVVTETNGILDPAKNEDVEAGRQRFVAEVEVMFHPVT
jgi:hypothetical protein